MNYIVGIGLVVLLQLAISGVTMMASYGNGSFIGLGAMILALYGVPATALVNFFLIRRHRLNPQRANVVRLIVISSILPTLQLLLLAAQLTLRL